MSGVGISLLQRLIPGKSVYQRGNEFMERLRSGYYLIPSPPPRAHDGEFLANREIAAFRFPDGTKTPFFVLLFDHEAKL